MTMAILKIANIVSETCPFGVLYALSWSNRRQGFNTDGHANTLLKKPRRGKDVAGYGAVSFLFFYFL